jgi:hypothetical protein
VQGKESEAEVEDVMTITSYNRSPGLEVTQPLDSRRIELIPHIGSPREGPGKTLSASEVFGVQRTVRGHEPPPSST